MPVFGQNINELGASKYPDVNLITIRSLKISKKMKRMITASKTLMLSL